MRYLPMALSLTMLVLVCRAHARQTNKTDISIPTVIQPTSDKQDWIARARMTADNPKKAREIILDGQFATDTRIPIHIAEAFELAYQQKKSPQRLACFAYAAMNARMLAYDRGMEPIQLEQRAMEALLHYPAGAEKGQNLDYLDVGSHFYLTSDNKIPEAWLAYGMYFAGHLDRKRAAEAYRQAIKLDPHFGEAWYALVNMEFEPYHGPIPAAHIPMILKQLDRAEKDEPRMHFFVIGWLSSLAADTGDYDTQLRLLRESVNLMPGTYSAKEKRKLIAALEKEHPGH